MSATPGRGLIVAAPSSGSGKTTVTLGLLRALFRRGEPIQAAKAGPDYIDPHFHAAACHAECINLDAWAMPQARLEALAAKPGRLIVEGAMGLFDGAPSDGSGSAADLARKLNLPVVLVVDCAHLAQSVAPVVSGLITHDRALRFAGVILNKVGSKRHETLLRNAMRTVDVPVLGAVLRDRILDLPSRHLGLRQAVEHPNLEPFLDHAGQVMENSIDLAQILAAMTPLPMPTLQDGPRRRRGVLAIARDKAFTFLYPHQLQQWRNEGWEVQFFSPLADDPVPDADRVFLPGGYPELHADRIAEAKTFLDTLREAGRTGDIYGECGGYMVLGHGLTDAQGTRHEMAGLLNLETSFKDRKLHLGYRQLTSKHSAMTGQFRGHEFHYASTLEASGDPLFEAWDSEGNELPPMGLRSGRVCGSFAHVIEAYAPSKKAGG